MFGIKLRRSPSPRFLSGTVNAPLGLPEVFPFGLVQAKLSRTAALRIESVAVASRTPRR